MVIEANVMTNEILLQQFKESVQFVMRTAQVRESEAKRIVKRFDLFKGLFN